VLNIDNRAYKLGLAIDESFERAYQKRIHKGASYQPASIVNMFRDNLDSRCHCGGHSTRKNNGSARKKKPWNTSAKKGYRKVHAATFGSSKFSLDEIALPLTDRLKSFPDMKGLANLVV